MIAAAILAVAWVLVVGSREELRGSPRWAEIAAGVLIVAGSVCVGVAVARWLPNPGFGVLAVVATIVIQARFLDVTTWPWNRSEGDQLRFLGFLAESHERQLTTSSSYVRRGGTSLYLGGLVAVMAGVALAREGMRRPVAIVRRRRRPRRRRPPGGCRPAPCRPLSRTRWRRISSNPATIRSVKPQPQRASAPTRTSPPTWPSWQDRVDATLGDVAGGRTRRPPAARGHSTPGDHRQQRRLLTQWRSRTACRPASPPACRRRTLWPADGHVHPPFDEESFPCSERDHRRLLPRRPDRCVGRRSPAGSPRRQRALHRQRSGPRRRRAVGRCRRHTRRCNDAARRDRRRVQRRARDRLRRLGRPADVGRRLHGRRRRRRTGDARPARRRRPCRARRRLDPLDRSANSLHGTRHRTPPRRDRCGAVAVARNAACP